MAWPKGKSKPKTGGRRPGSPNRRTLILAEVLTSLDCDLPKRIVELLPQLQPQHQMEALLRLMEYVYPKRKSVELAGQEGSPVALEIVRKDFERVLSDPKSKEAARLIAERIAAGANDA